MTISLPGVVMLIFAIWTMIKGFSILRPFRSYKKNREEAHRIYNRRVIVGEVETLGALDVYFFKFRDAIYSTAIHFFLSFILVFVSLSSAIRNSDTASPLWQIFLFSIFLFILPIMIVITTAFDLKSIREDVLIRFRGEN